MIPSEFVDRYYTMNPKTEDLVYADQLTEGMVVLIEDSKARTEPLGVQTFGNPSTQEQCRRENRWCKVGNLRKFAPPQSGPAVSFIGVYADGTKFVRNVSAYVGFFVKKDSIQQEESNASEATELENMEDQSDLVRYAEADAEATKALWVHTPKPPLVITKDQLERVGKAVRSVIPEAEFKFNDDIWFLELTVDEPEEPSDKEQTFVDLQRPPEEGGPLAKALRFMNPDEFSKGLLREHSLTLDVNHNSKWAVLSTEGPIAQYLRDKEIPPRNRRY